MNWEGYEELVKDIYQELGKATGVTIECWGRSCRVQGKSGEFHQIDVLTSHNDGLHTYRTAIECKYWKEKVSKGQVLEHAGKIDDANLEKGILVSKRGFTSSAVAVAKEKNVGLIHLRRPVSSDWDGRLKSVSGEINYIVDVVCDYNLVCRRTDVRDPHNTKVNIREVLMTLTNGTELTVSEIADSIRDSGKSNDDDVESNGYSWEMTPSPIDDSRSYVVKFPENTLLKRAATQQELYVKELSFKVKQTVFIIPIHIDHQDYVDWIMRAIFEEKTFAISPDHVPTRWE